MPDLPDLSIDTTSASIVVRPSFEQLNATLFSRGYLRTPLNVAGLAPQSIEALADALHAIIAQREEDLDVRSALTAKTRTLTASLERTKRFLHEQSEKCADSERKAEAAKSKANAIQHALQAEQHAHKATKEALNKSRRELQLVKASALQHRASSDHNVARVRSRIGEVTATALRASVPDFRIVSSAFDEVLPGSAKARAPTMAEQQVEELEKKRTELMDYNQALKRLATEAINAVRRADAELLDIVEAEEEHDQKSGGLPATSASASDLASSSYGSSSGKKKSPASDAWLQGHGALFQRDLFPASQPFTTAAAAAATAAASSSRSTTLHPALQALSTVTHHFAGHVQALLDLRTSRRVHEAEESKRTAREARESAWQAQLHLDVKAEIEDDAQFSVNRQNALCVNGAPAAASKKQAWQEEKKDLERKLVDTIKRLAVAEQNVARREKEVRKLEKSEKKARRLVDEHQRSGKEGLPADEAKASSSSADGEAVQKQLQKEREEVKAEKRRYAELSEALEQEREQLACARERVRVEEAESRAMSAAAATTATTQKTAEGQQPAASRRTVSRLDPTDMPSRSSAAERLPPVIEGLELSSGVGEEEARMDLDDAATAKVSPPALPTSFSSPPPAKKAQRAIPAAPSAATSNPELDAIFGRGFSALTSSTFPSSSSSFTSPPSRTAAAPAAEETASEESRRRKSSRLSSSSTPSSASSAPSTRSDASEKRKEPHPSSSSSNETSTLELRKSRRLSDRNVESHRKDEAEVGQQGTERKRRRVELASGDVVIEQRRSSEEQPRKTTTSETAPASSEAPASSSGASSTRTATSSRSRRLSMREQMEQSQPTTRVGAERRRVPSSSSISAAAAGTAAGERTARPRPVATSSSSSSSSAAAVVGEERRKPSTSASRVTAPTASSLGRRVASSSSTADAREKERETKVLTNATNRTSSSRDKEKERRGPSKTSSAPNSGGAKRVMADPITKRIRPPAVASRR